MADEEKRKDDDGVTVKLSKSVRVLNETKDELKFREPSAWDIDKIGDPFPWVSREDGRGMRQDCNYSILISMLCELGGGLPPGTFGKQMRGRDLVKCRFAVQSFFTPEWDPLPTESTSDSSP